jgi:hypothetical protein
MPQEKRMSNKDYIASKSDKPYFHMEGSDRSFAREGRGQDAMEEFRRNNKWYRDKNSSMGLLKTLDHMLSTENTGTAAGRRMGMKQDAAEEYGRQTARNSRPSYGAGKPVAKPLSAAAGAKMVGAMSGKSNGTFAGGSPRSSMSKNLKIK